MKKLKTAGIASILMAGFLAAGTANAIVLDIPPEQPELQGLVLQLDQDDTFTGNNPWENDRNSTDKHVDDLWEVDRVIGRLFKINFN